MVRGRQDDLYDVGQPRAAFPGPAGRPDRLPRNGIIPLPTLNGPRTARRSIRRRTTSGSIPWPGGPARPLTEKWDHSASNIEWSADGKTIYTTSDNLGQHSLARRAGPTAYREMGSFRFQH